MVEGHILEVGSKQYGNANDFRQLFKTETYIGVDQEPGKGVDVVCDFTSDYELIKNKMGIEKFKTVICFSVLEHCKYPLKMAENISRFLAERGVIFISVPFVWEIHTFPDDYWRFTPASLSVLFPECELVEDRSFYYTKIRGERLPLTANLARQEIFAPTVIMRIMRRFGLVSSKYSCALFPTLLNAILVKKSMSIT